MSLGPGIAARPGRGPSPTSSPRSRAQGARPRRLRRRPGPRPSLPRAYPIVPVRGDGLTIEDIDGNLFLDFAAGIAVTSTGHSHPQVVAAIKEQAARADPLQRLGLLPPDLRRDAVKRIAGIAPMDGPVRVYLGNSGTEVVEAAIKLARVRDAPAVRRRLPRRLPRPDATAQSRLTASKAKYHAGFGPLLPGIFHAPYGRAEDLALVQRGPVRASSSRPTRSPPSSSSRSRARAATSSRRTASSRACAGSATSTGSSCRRRDPVGRRAHRQDVGGRALGRQAGHPAAPPRASPAACPSGRWSPGRTCSRPGATGAHGSTYGGNPVACAAALATIDLLEGGLVENAATRGTAGARPGSGALAARYPGPDRDVRGKGLMIGIEFDTRGARRGGPVGLLRARPARPRVRHGRASGCRRR